MIQFKIMEIQVLFAYRLLMEIFFIFHKYGIRPFFLYILLIPTFLYILLEISPEPILNRKLQQSSLNWGSFGALGKEKKNILKQEENTGLILMF